MHVAIVASTSVFDLLQIASAEFDSRYNSDFWLKWHLVVTLDFKNSSEAITLVELVDEVINMVHAFKLVCAVLLNGQLTEQYFVNELWNVLSGFPAPKSCTFPLTTSNKLEWSCF